jgi:YgiT-type zinc finger domain-containing protein
MECPHCRGILVLGRVTYAAHRRRYQLRFDDLAGWTCQQCGEAVFEERVVAAIQQLLITLDAGMERVGHGTATQPQSTDGAIAEETAMDTSPDVSGREHEEETMTPEQAFARLQEWVAEHSKALTGISAVELVREMRQSR